MKKFFVMIPLLLLPSALRSESYTKQPCKTLANASTCQPIHGRLRQGNGTPSTRLWHIGTGHVYGIYSNLYGFLHDGSTGDNEHPALPPEITKQKSPDGYLDTIFADFEICPLEPQIEHHMQAACIEGATHIFAKH